MYLGSDQNFFIKNKKGKTSVKHFLLEFYVLSLGIGKLKLITSIKKTERNVFLLSEGKEALL